MVVTRTYMYLPLEMHWSRHDPVFHSYLNLKFVSMHVVLYLNSVLMFCVIFLWIHLMNVFIVWIIALQLHWS